MTMNNQDVNGSSLPTQEGLQHESGWTKMSLADRLSELEEMHSRWSSATESSKAWPNVEEQGMTQKLSPSVQELILDDIAKQRLQILITQAGIEKPERQGTTESSVNGSFAEWVVDHLVQTADAFHSLDETKRRCRWIQSQASQNKETTGKNKTTSLREGYLSICSPTATSFFLSGEIRKLSPILQEVISRYPNEQSRCGFWTEFSNSLIHLQAEWQSPNKLSQSEQEQIYWKTKEEEEAYAVGTADNVKEHGLEWLSVIPSYAWPRVHELLRSHYKERIRISVKKARQRRERAPEGGASASASLWLDLDVATNDAAAATELREEATATPLGSEISSPTFIGSDISSTAVSEESPTVAEIPAALGPETSNPTITESGASIAVTRTRDEAMPVAHDTSGSFFSVDRSNPSRALFTRTNLDKAMREMTSKLSNCYDPSFSATAFPERSSFVETYASILPILTRFSMTANERKANGDQEEAIRQQMLALDYTWKGTHHEQMLNFLNKNQEKIQGTSDDFQSLIQAKMEWDESRMAYAHGSLIDDLTEWTPDDQKVVTLKHQKAKAEVELRKTDAMEKWETWRASLSGSKGSGTAQERLLSEWKASTQNTKISGWDSSYHRRKTGGRRRQRNWK